MQYCELRSHCRAQSHPVNFHTHPAPIFPSLPSARGSPSLPGFNWVLPQAQGQPAGWGETPFSHLSTEVVQSHSLQTRWWGHKRGCPPAPPEACIQVRASISLHLGSSPPLWGPPVSGVLYCFQAPNWLIGSTAEGLEITSRVFLKCF